MRILFNLGVVGLGVILSAVMSGCSGNSSSGNDSDSLRADSIAAAEEEANLVEWPDTSYQSASNVVIAFEQSDSVSGKLSSIADLYRRAPGAFTFRGGEHRDADFGGRLDSIPSDIQVDWTFETSADNNPTKFGTWGGGTGWTGQPLYVEWPDSVLTKFKASGLEAAKKEIIVGSLCGEVYFIDYETGKKTRPAVPTLNPIKGTISLDPTLNGNLYVGQGVPSRTEISALTIDIFKNEITHRFGPDHKAWRHWFAYDSSPVRVGQFLFRPGENGTLYKYTVEAGTLKPHSSVKYRVNGAAPGMEASMAVSRNYGYTGDNYGNIICWNLNTLKPVWHYKLPDDTDSTPIVAEEDGKVYLYAGCEVEHPGVTKAHYVKLDALTGKELWVNETPAQRANVGEKHFDGGFYGTPLLGRGDCSELLFANVVNNTKGQNGSFVAIERATGKTRYSIPLKYYAWSSPVGYLTKSNQQIVFTGDCTGNAYLINGKDGKILCIKHIGNNFESSPVVVGNTAVVGSRGSSIYRLSIK